MIKIIYSLRSFNALEASDQIEILIFKININKNKETNNNDKKY